jgi:hypothetical protein
VDARHKAGHIDTSFKGGHYIGLFGRYQEILARSHLKVEQRLTKGAAENLKLLNDPASGIQIGFMQGWYLGQQAIALSAVVGAHRLSTFLARRLSRT